MGHNFAIKLPNQFIIWLLVQVVLLEQVDAVTLVRACEVLSIGADNQLLNFRSALVRDRKVRRILLLELIVDAHNLDLTLGQGDEQLTIWSELHASDQSLSRWLTILRVTNLGSFLGQHSLITTLFVLLRDVIENDKAEVVLVIIDSDPAIILGHGQVWLIWVHCNC